MENISEFQEDLRDLDFGNEELEIVQESYVALEKSYDILHKAKNPSHQAIQLHRIHVQSLADRLGVQMNTVAVESFSSKTMHAFALEESEGFFAKIGKAIAAIFKWIKDAVVGIFRFIFGMSSGNKAEKQKAAMDKASEFMEKIKVELEEELVAKVTITATNDKGEQVTEVKELHGSLALLQGFLENPMDVVKTLDTLFGLTTDTFHELTNFSEKYRNIPDTIAKEDLEQKLTEVREFAVDKMSFLEKKYGFGTTSTGHKDITPFHTGRWDKPVDMSDPSDPEKNKTPKGESMYYAFGVDVDPNNKYKQSKKPSDKSFTINKSTFTNVKNSLEAVQKIVEGFSKTEKSVLSTLEKVTRDYSNFVQSDKKIKDDSPAGRVNREVRKIENRFAADAKNIVHTLGEFIQTVAKLQRSFYDLSMKVVKLAEDATLEDFNKAMLDKESIMDF